MPKKNAKQQMIAAVGVCAAAASFAVAHHFDANSNVAVGQVDPSANAPTEPAVPAPGVGATDALTSSAPSAVPAAVVPQSGLPGAPAAVVPQSGLPGAPAAVVPQPGLPQARLANPQLASSAPAADPNAELASLRARQKELQTQMQRMPTSLADQQAQQAVYTELLDLQDKIQKLEAQAGQFAAYRQNRDRQAGVGQYQPQDPGAFAQAADPANPLDALRQKRQQELNESGLNSGSLYARTDAGAGLTPGEVALLREQKEGLTQQYNQIQQTLRALQPGDAALSENLQQELTSVLKQLREIDARLAAAPKASLDAQGVPSVANGTEPFVIPPQNRLNINDAQALGSTSISMRMQKVNQAAQLLREAGLLNLADHATMEVPKLADPNYRETRLVPGTWAEGDGLAESRNNPFKQVGAKDIEQINNKIDSLQKQVETLTKTLTDVEAQLKLLTLNTVAPANDVPPEAFQLDGQAPSAHVPVEAVPANPADNAAPVDLGVTADEAAPIDDGDANAPDPIKETIDRVLPPIPGENDFE